MKNSILNSMLLAALLAGTLLTSESVYGMQLNSIEDDSSGETESLSEDEGIEQPAGWGVRTFFTGARELLYYGRLAAGDLFRVNPREDEGLSLIGATEIVQDYPLKKSIVGLFLSNPDDYKNSMECLPDDKRWMLASYLLTDHPLVKVIRGRLCRHFCLTLGADPSAGLRSVQFNASGNRVVTASEDGTAKIWDVQSGECLRTLRGHTVCVLLAQFNAPGNRVVTVSMDRTAKIWDVDLGECLRTLAGHAEFVWSAQFNASGNKVLTASGDGTPKIWNVDSGECLFTLSGHAGNVSSAQFNEAGDRIVTASRDGTAKIWDVESGECLRTLNGHADWVGSAQFNASGNRVVTVSEDQTAKIWDVDSGECVRTLAGHADSVWSAEFNASGNKVLTASGDGTAKIWDVDLGECLGTLTHADQVNTAEFNASGNRVVSASRDETANIWDVDSGECIFTLRGHTDTVNSARFNRRGNRVVTTSTDKTAKIWDVKKLLACSSWFDRECTLEQALLLHCVYETCITQALLKKRNPIASLRFDFNKCPHLQEYFETMPPEIQACLEPFVIKKA